jgi:uncharacterized membrane protein
MVVMKRDTAAARDTGKVTIETPISYILICGVIVSLILEVIGIVLFYRTFHSTAVSQEPAMFVRGEDFFTFLADLFRQKTTQTPGIRLMTLGIAFLILTPYLRAVLSVIYFAVEKNLKYFVITIFVLMILTFSLALH